MKKLSRNEVNVITQEVRNKVNEIKLKDIKEKSKKDKDCINLIKLNNDKKLLNDKISNINVEMSKITESLHKKYNTQYTFCINSYNNNIVNDLQVNNYSSIRLCCYLCHSNEHLALQCEIYKKNMKGNLIHLRDKIHSTTLLDFFTPFKAFKNIFIKE